MTSCATTYSNIRTHHIWLIQTISYHTILRSVASLPTWVRYALQLWDETENTAGTRSGFYTCVRVRCDTCVRVRWARGSSVQPTPNYSLTIRFVRLGGQTRYLQKWAVHWHWSSQVRSFFFSVRQSNQVFSHYKPIAEFIISPIVGVTQRPRQLVRLILVVKCSQQPVLISLSTTVWTVRQTVPPLS